jgi:two-component system LytT family response regulator
MGTLQPNPDHRIAARVIVHPAAQVVRTGPPQQPRRVALPSAEGIRFVDQVQIEFCRSEGNYCHIQLCSGESIMIAKTLKWVMSRLAVEMFLRVHASYVIAYAKVALLAREQLTMNSGKKIPISRNRRTETRDAIMANAVR